MKRLLFFALSLVVLTFANISANAQANVLNSSDPDVIFTSTNQPAAPAWNQISKWGHTNRLSWGPYSYGYLSYYFQGMAFRLKFPKSYKQGVSDGKKYPVFIFFHGIGEAGNIWDNEYQLFHGGQPFAQAVNDSLFDGFILVPQSSNGYLQDYFPSISNLLDSMVKYTKADLDRVTVDGLSGGGQATWDFLGNQTYAQQTCSALPISAADYSQEPTFASFVTIPIWVANGGQDIDPYPSTVIDIMNYYRSLGGSIIQTFYPTQGHGVWDSFWAEPNFWPWIVAQHKANPLVYFQHNAFCPNQPVTAKLGVQSGFFAYQWEKNGVTISGAKGDTLNVTAFGTYACRYERTATSGWSAWSPTPVVISQMQPTITPPIQINGLHTSILPAPDGSTTVPLMVANNYFTYEWHNITGGKDSIVSTANTLNAPVGQYEVRVTQQFGCSSNFSPLYNVIAASGSSSAPTAATSLTATILSNTGIQLDWNSNPHPVHADTAFEIYRSTTSGTNYTLIAVTGASTLTYTDQGLTPNTKYYYIIRAVNGSGAAPVSNEAAGLTLSDVVAPTAPSSLAVTYTTRNSVSLSWNAATDDVGVSRYDIYINGVKSYSVNGTTTTFTVQNLTALQSYTFYVKARDGSGNVSPASNQVTGSAVLDGLQYSYYQGTWSVLPAFSTIMPITTGVSPNVSLTPALQTVDYGFVWQGYIKIPTTGSYTFETNSDDGSKLFLAPYSDTATALVNNDGLHGAQSVTAKVTLTAGVYPISMLYFQNGGGASMNVYWTSTAAGITRQLIPNSAFSDAVTLGSVPAAPGALNVIAASYNKINLTWTDNSANETGFEITRATSRTGIYSPIATTAAGVTSYSDSIGLSPNTKYWYKIRSINQNGASAFVSTLLGAWFFNGDLTDGSGNNYTLTGSGSPTFSSSAKEGSSSLSLNGSSQYADMTFTSTFPSDAYTSRSISAWINPTSATTSGTNKIVYDLGGSDNGIALRFNAGSLQVGVAGSNVRSTISDVIATDANWVSGGWNNVTVVYNVNSIQLFVNGVSRGTASLTFSSIAASTSLSRVGASNGTNAFNSSSTSTNYGGLIDDIEIVNEPMNATGILALMNQSYTAATTLGLPAIPAAPSNLVAQATSPTTVSLSFKDNSSNETGFQVYRAITSDANFRLQTTLPAGSGAGTQINYTDAGLFSNTNYYYQVRAIGVGGNSAFTSPEVLVTTLNNPPVVNPIASFTMRYASQVTIPVTATDVDADPITLSVLNLPSSFATFTSTGGSGSLQFSPALANVGSFIISVVAQDTHGGTDTVKFTVTVNSNYVPVATAVSNQTMNAGDSLIIPLTATDQDGNSTLAWSITSAPAFATIGSTSNGTANLKFKPGYGASGSYSVTATVSDGAGGVVPVTFNLTVVKVSPPAQSIFMDVRNSSPNAPAPWNNITGVSTSGLLDNTGAATGVSLNFLSTPWNTSNMGAVTGNNSGVYPDAAMSDYFWFGVYGAPSTVSFTLSGLTTTASYNVTLFGSSTYTGAGANGSTNYTINGVQKSLNISNNTQNTVTFSAIAPDVTGTITVNMSLAAGSPYGAINAIVLQKPFDDGTAPVLPTGLAAQALSNGYVKLSWVDVAYNESNYIVYRSTSVGGPFTALTKQGNANDSTYTDSTVSGNTSYYYEIAATNAHGSSGQTSPVSVTTLNKIPSLAAISNVFAKTGQTTNVSVTATDDPSNVLTTTVSNLPAFAAYQSTGNGTGNIVITPTVNDPGVYRNIIVSVKDNFGSSVADTFSLYVADTSLRTVYVRYGGPGIPTAAAPWNNYLSYPFANNPLTNLIDDGNTNTGFSIKLNDVWDGNFAYGMTTGTNSGIFPDNVMLNSIDVGNTNNHVIEIDGLNPAKTYNVGFFTSFNSGVSSIGHFTNGSQTVTLDGKYNTTTEAQLNGLKPNSSGVITVTVAKDASATYLNLCAMMIQEYNATTTPVRPYDLFASTILDSSKIVLTWSDRSSNETGFQVYRSTSANGTYTLVTTTAANVTTYTNTGLTRNTRYYYKVRAINGALTSNYSNIATVALASKIVLVHLDVTYPAPAPWNSTNAEPDQGSVFSNLVDNTNTNTGEELTITKSFEGEFPDGLTGSGIFPSNVMQASYWTDAGETSEVKFDNLDLRKKYRIGFFGSSNWTGFFNANYTVNGTTVSLNSYENNSKIVYLDGIVPNSNGEIYIDVAAASGSPYSFTGALTIESYDDTTTYTPPSLSRPAVSNEDTAAVQAQTLPVASNSDIRVYPDPFTDKLTVELNSPQSSKVGLVLYDANSRLVYKGEATKQAGDQFINIEIPNANRLTTGNYIFNVIVDGKISKSVILIKVN